MSISIVYILLSSAVNNSQTNYLDYAQRFADTFRWYPPLHDYQLIIVCNDCSPDEQIKSIFKDIPCIFIEGNNIGWDIGAYIDISSYVDTDAMLCLGSYVWFKKQGWLKRISEAWNKHGEGMYGFFGSYQTRPHLQTGAFCTSPALLRSYPYPIESRKDRYEFEHGFRSFWHMVAFFNKPVLLVTWDGEYEPAKWMTPINGYRNGDQSNCIMFHNHSDMYEISDNRTKRVLSQLAGVQC